ncbi:MAG: ABC-2 transporter permease [Lachnospiraceae bacterium]|nr:ABC-2 transporter permease [Lachnospiraceae bacterium]
MLSLIYRELRLTRKTLGTCLLVYFLYAILTNLVALSAQIGNLAKYCDAEQLTLMTNLSLMAVTFGYLILLVAVPEALFQVMDGDFKTPWLKYAFASPKSCRELIGAKYLTYLLLTLCAIVLGLIHLFVSFGIAHRPVSGDTILIYLGGALFAMMISAIFIPLACYFQNMAYVNGAITVVMFVVFLGLTVSAMRFFFQNEDAQPLDYVEAIISKLQHLLSYPAWAVLKNIAPFLAVLVIIGSYFLSSQILDRRRLVKGGDVKTAHISHAKGGKL